MRNSIIPCARRGRRWDFTWSSPDRAWSSWFAARFATKKKARALDELMEVIYLVVQVSLVLKENIFDRPEVKEFFSQSSKEIYFFAQKYVAMVLPKTKAIRPTHRARSV